MILFGCQSGFSDTEIGDIQAAIKQDFENKGLVVIEVKLEKQSKYSLSGFVRFKKNVSYIGEMEFTKTCDATMDQTTSQYTWKCDDRL